MNSVVVVVVDMANEKISMCFAKNAGSVVLREATLYIWSRSSCPIMSVITPFRRPTSCCAAGNFYPARSPKDERLRDILLVMRGLICHLFVCRRCRLKKCNPAFTRRTTTSHRIACITRLPDNQYCRWASRRLSKEMSTARGRYRSTTTSQSLKPPNRPPTSLRP